MVIVFEFLTPQLITSRENLLSSEFHFHTLSWRKIRFSVKCAKCSTLLIYCFQCQGPCFNLDLMGWCCTILCPEIIIINYKLSTKRGGYRGWRYFLPWAGSYGRNSCTKIPLLDFAKQDMYIFFVHDQDNILFLFYFCNVMKTCSIVKALSEINAVPY